MSTHSIAPAADGTKAPPEPQSAPAPARAYPPIPWANEAAALRLYERCVRRAEAQLAAEAAAAERAAAEDAA